MLYRLYTEDKNREAIVKIVSQETDGFTLIPAIGYWKGQPENSLIIELDGLSAFDAGRIAEAIRQANNQQAVLVQEIVTESKLVTEKGLQYV